MRSGCGCLLLILVAVFIVAAMFSVVPYEAACDAVRDATDRRQGWCGRD